MTEENRIPGRPDWASGPLYKKFCEMFPGMRTPSGVLDVKRLKGEIGRSHEAIYKWFRKGQMPAAAGRKAVEAARRLNPAVKVDPRDLVEFY